MPGAVAEGLLEREGEIARLDLLLGEAANGTGAAVIVEGAPGIGKTSLLDAAATLASSHGLSVLRARGGELERALAFGVARDLLARRVVDAEEELRARIEAGVSRTALPALGLGTPQFPPPDEAAIHHGLTWLVADLADEHPLALIVDDVQWADDASAAWLAHLARRIADLPAALVLAARPPDRGELAALVALRDLPELERVRPAPLEHASVAALVRSFYAADADDDFITACHTAAGGNPFHTHALLDSAAEQAIPATPAGVDALRLLAPEAVRRSVAAALRRCGAEATALAQACATLGETVELRHAAELAGLGASAASTAADRLADQNLLAPSRPLRFAHPVLLAAVRDSLAIGERNERHRHAADLFLRDGDTRRAAAHLLEVEPAGDGAVVDTLMAAVGQAVAEGAVAHAARLLERALAEPPPSDQRALLLGLLGKAKFQSHGAGAPETLLAAAEVATDSHERAELFAYAGYSQIFETGSGVAEVARRIDANPPTTREGRLRVDGMLGTMTRLTGALPYRPSTPELIARAEPLSGATIAEREFIAATVVAADWDVALPAARLADLALRGLAHPETPDSGAVFNGGHVVVGAPHEILAGIDDYLAACEQGGLLASGAACLQARAGAYYMLGRLREAEADARLLWERSAYEKSFVWAGALSLLLMVLAARGLIDEGRDLIERHSPFPQGELVYEGLKYGTALIALEAGDPAAAMSALLAYEAMLEQRGLRDAPALPISHLTALVEALVRSGQPERALGFAEKELAVARAREAPGRIGFALRCVGLARGGAEGRALIEEGIELLEASPERAHLARGLLDLGRALRHEGRPTEAREPLRRALELAGQCGAELVADGAFDELRATGAKPRRRALSGPDSLTASEARVARLAAEGRTNREIAQALYVSAKTVETHLGHIYAKLDIKGRGELAAGLAAQPG